MDANILVILLPVLALKICVGIHGSNVSDATSSTIHATVVTTGHRSVMTSAVTHRPTSVGSTGHSVTSQSTAEKQTTTADELKTTKELVTETAATGSVTSAVHTSGTEQTSTVKTTPTPCPSRKSFDAASFVGGIVLGLGVCVILYFVYRWVRSRRQVGAPYQQF